MGGTPCSYRISLTSFNETLQSLALRFSINPKAITKGFLKGASLKRRRGPLCRGRGLHFTIPSMSGVHNDQGNKVDGGSF